MFNEGNILNAEIWLSKFFADNASDYQVEARFAIGEFKEFFRGTELQKADLKEARKRLEVQSENVNGQYIWTWKQEKAPVQVWEEKCEQFWREIDEREGH